MFHVSFYSRACIALYFHQQSNNNKLRQSPNILFSCSPQEKDRFLCSTCLHYYAPAGFKLLLRSVFSSDSTTHSWKVRQKSKNKDGKYVRLGLDGMAGGGGPGWQIGNTIIAANITNYSGTHWPGKHAGDMFGKKTLKDKHFTCHDMTPAYLIAKAAAFSCTMPMQCFTHYTVGYMSDITLILANSQSFPCSYVCYYLHMVDMMDLVTGWTW